MSGRDEVGDDTGEAKMGSADVGPNGELLPLNTGQLAALTVGLLGLQFCWAVQVGNATKQLMELGMASGLVSYAWLAGYVDRFYVSNSMETDSRQRSPVAGIIVQPVVGAWSDRCTSRWGRRRPFLAAGTAVTALCLVLFAFARQLGELLGDVTGVSNGKRAVRPRALTIAVMAFWALDFALNAAQGPLRALLADRVPAEQHATGNSYFALMTGLGNLSGSLAGAVKLSTVLTMFPDDFAALYTVAAVAVVCCMAITVLFTDETPLEPRPHGEYANMEETTNRGGGVAGGIRGLWAAWADAPSPFHRVFAVQCATWVGWFALYVFGTSWVGSAVYGGQADAPEGTPLRKLYDEGVRTGNFGFALQSVVTVLVSLLVPKALQLTGTRFVYIGGHVVLATALLGAKVTRDRNVAVALLAATGVPWAITMAVPWSLMGQGVSKQAPGKEGVYFTLFNLSQCFPEVFVSVVSPFIVRATQSQATVLGFGGLVALAGAIAIFVLRIGADERADFDRLPATET